MCHIQLVNHHGTLIQAKENIQQEVSIFISVMTAWTPPKTYCCRPKDRIKSAPLKRSGENDPHPGGDGRSAAAAPTPHEQGKPFPRAGVATMASTLPSVFLAKCVV